MNETIQKLDKPLSEWRELLSSETYAVLFEEATERAGTSSLNQEKRPGTFICAACHLPLFESVAKYESGTGWPSFYAPLEGSLETRTDYKASAAADGVPLYAVWWTPRPRVQGRPAAHRPAVLQQRCCPQVRAGD